jgi:ribosomal protein L11 methyltransferase
MAWLALRVFTRTPDFAEEILTSHGAQAVSFLDGADTPILEPLPGETPLWPDTVTVGWFLDTADLAPARAALAAAMPEAAALRTETVQVEDQDWVRVWLEHWHPLKFGERLWVVPREKRDEVPRDGAAVLRLDPGLAFGTGTHPTTALCLEWLAQHELAGKTVLDFGCGSGILAIAALLLGAERAVCVDIDPQALVATRNNALANGVESRITTLLPAQFTEAAHDLVLANILANPLIALAPLLTCCAGPGAPLVMAGLLDRQADEVRAAYATHFAFEPQVSREGWTRLAARRVKA